MWYLNWILSDSKAILSQSTGWGGEDLVTSNHEEQSFLSGGSGNAPDSRVELGRRWCIMVPSGQRWHLCSWPGLWFITPFPEQSWRPAFLPGVSLSSLSLSKMQPPHPQWIIPLLQSSPFWGLPKDAISFIFFSSFSLLPETHKCQIHYITLR